MITKNNFRSVLASLGFSTDDNNLYIKHFKHHDAYLKVDFKKELLIYPEEKGLLINDKYTTSFSDNENFVVFEAVHRLLEKGYKPNHIELERKWPLGHLRKSGRADICVMDETGMETLLIIECKTYGSEYRKALRDLETDGGQLFSYLQQERSTKWVSLYASTFNNNKVIYTNDVIQTVDDPNILELNKKDSTIQLYKNTTTADELFDVWKETYGMQLWENIIFNEETIAYQIGIKPLRKRDLKEFNPDDKIVNKFEEILRHNNVSDKENAFNRLVALFICKLVDEITKNDDDEVEFQYKIGTDTYESLQDRLQRLHKQGMEKFIKEEIFYVSSDYPEQLFSNYTGVNRQRAIEDLKEKFKILKFYTNNDFAFKDVHNEELFLQNGKILVEMVQLFEKYKIVYASKHQFLGDLFEQLLNKGFKQNEGQFFTPTPITSFVWDSLPLETFKNSDKSSKYPKTIDYACGAGHFLTDGVEAINNVFNPENNLWVSDHIYGIEKDYRLARVSKISLFMNGAGEGNIIFGDGLENNPDKNISENSFDILVANPPYSVAAFKKHLKLKNNSFELMDTISNSGGEIEVLFVERIAQLLKPRGVAAVVLPTSVLVNNSESYIGARETILKNFYIRSVVQLSNKTFGATGTNTVIMFLEKFNEPPKKHLLLEDTINLIFNNSDVSDWKDKEIYESYLLEIDVKIDDYDMFLREEMSLDNLEEIDYFYDYVNEYKKSTQYRNLISRRTFKNLDKSKQIELIEKECYNHIKRIEKEKLYYHSLVYDQKTLVVVSPTAAEEQKQFLGYWWSNRKGQEGIQILDDGGMLYDENDRYSTEKISYYIRDTFNELYDIPTSSDWDKYAKIFRTPEIFNYDKTDFNKAINISLKSKFVPKTQFDNIRLARFPGDVKIIKGTSITKADAIPGKFKVVAGGQDYAYTHNEYNREGPVITISASGYAGFVNLWNENIFSSDSITIQANTEEKTKFIYYYLKTFQDEVYNLGQGIAQKHVYVNDLESFLIPLIPEPIQNKIVEENEKITQLIFENKNKIETLESEIISKFNSLSKGNNNYRLNDDKTFELSIGNRVLKREVSDKYDIPVYSANVFEPFGNINKLLLKDFSKPSIVWGIDGDWMVNIFPEDYKFYPTDHCGVMRVDETKINPKFAAYMLGIVGEEYNFSRNKRASLDRIRELNFYGSSITVQNEVVSEIILLEKEILKLKKENYELEEQLKNTLMKYFN